MTQSDALKILKMGKNVFLTGSAGAGKTYVLNAFISYLHEHGMDVAITASTGIAATHMGGTTIHAWSGIGIRSFLSDYDIEMLEGKKYLWDRFEKVKILIIDEVSMLSGDFLDMLDRVCRAFKRNNIPFGGIQIILSGDLFQLPPIEKNGMPKMIFESNAWATMGLAVCYLTEQHRQDDDQFLSILNAMRANEIKSVHLGLLESRITEYDDESFTNITKLFTHNADVDTINDRELHSINEPEEVYRMTGKGKANLIENLQKSCLAPQVLRLKIGTQVMFVKNNFDAGYVNGTRGIVIDFDPDSRCPVVKTLAGKEVTVESADWSVEDNGKILASISQIPLRHAWAITVHKSQGMSLDAAVIDLSKTFTYGMGYVALSRVRKLSGVHLVGFNPDALLVDPKIFAIDQRLQQLSNGATKRLTEISDEELKKSHDEFIIKSGGKLEAKKLSKKEKKEAFAKSAGASKRNHEATYELVKSGKTISEAAKETGFVTETIINHLNKARELGLDVNFPHIKPKDSDIEIIKEAYQQMKDKVTEKGEQKIAPIKAYLDKNGFDFGYDTIKLAKLYF